LVWTSKLKLVGEVLIQQLWKGDRETRRLHRVRLIWVSDVQKAGSR
jgi:hypothetical protein